MSSFHYTKGHKEYQYCFVNKACNALILSCESPEGYMIIKILHQQSSMGTKLHTKWSRWTKAEKKQELVWDNSAC